MKYENYRIKAKNKRCPFYFKVVTADDLTEIYFVQILGGEVKDSMQLYCGPQLAREKVLEACRSWLQAISGEYFDFERDEAVGENKARELAKPLEWTQNGQEIHASVGDCEFVILNRDGVFCLEMGDEEYEFDSPAEAKNFAQEKLEDFVRAACGWENGENKPPKGVLREEERA